MSIWKLKKKMTLRPNKIGCLRIILRYADFLQPVNITCTHKEVTSRSKNVVADLGTNDPISHVRSTGTLARADSVLHRNNQRTQLPAVSWYVIVQKSQVILFSSTLY
ncbi:hypothetical protein CTI12_AA278980 [Artemisia annua]|uniref:Uncharacterized protein n=1 Tax=Artemisia annua TaxID=35608 RepID=A0A2U1NDG9_ARTAN|nr:hypothetical protein CTI12_AA278980 [Artemisia annua]